MNNASFDGTSYSQICLFNYGDRPLLYAISGNNVSGDKQVRTNKKHLQLWMTIVGYFADIFV